MRGRTDGTTGLHPWYGWTVHTHGGDEVGSVTGQFDTGAHAGRLRVHRARNDGTAVFAIPLNAVVSSIDGLIILEQSASAALAEWLTYLIRHHAAAPEPLPSWHLMRPESPG